MPKTKDADRAERFVDTDLSFISLGGAECHKCKHLNEETNDDGEETCKAFPAGIPDDIIIGDTLHRVPVDGDNGITFEPRDE